MLSESARMSSAAETRFRVQTPNSQPREIKIIALDEPSERVVHRLMRRSWEHATFFTSSSGSLTDLSGAPRSLGDEVGTAHLVVMVAGPGGQAEAAQAIGRECSRVRVNTTALIAGATSASDEALSRTLQQVRPWSLMVVIAEADEYIDDMLTALRA